MLGKAAAAKATSSRNQNAGGKGDRTEEQSVTPEAGADEHIGGKQRAGERDHAQCEVELGEVVHGGFRAPREGLPALADIRVETRERQCAAVRRRANENGCSPTQITPSRSQCLETSRDERSGFSARRDPAG